MRIERKQAILLVLTILWMAFIFSFSARPADESTQMSLSVGKWIGQSLVPGYDRWNETEQETFARNIDYPVRKCAHASEYAVLGIMLSSLALSFDKPGEGGMAIPWKRIMAATLTGILYAASDEFHQLFVPGRSGQFTDVLIDSMGLLMGIIFALLAVRYCRKRRKCRDGHVQS